MLQSEEVRGGCVSGAKMKRAPRPLTGRHVRPGTGASPKTLLLLRQKVLERMRLKDLLGDEGHAFFGAMKKKGLSVSGSHHQPKKRGRSKR